MTAVLSIDRRDDLGGRSSSASYSHLMQRHSRAEDRAGAIAHSDGRKDSTNTTQRSSQQEQERHRPSSAVRHNKEPFERYSTSDESDRPLSPQLKMKDRYSYRDEDTAASPSSYPQADDWRRSNKRRHSQRSSSRPRSQQGSQAAQIATIKEAERENEQGRFSRSAVDEEHSLRPAVDLPRKTPRLDQASTSASRTTDGESEWPANRSSRTNEALDPSTTSTSRLPGSHVHPPSANDETEANYTWQQRNRSVGREAGEGTSAGAHSPLGKQNRLPALLTGYRPHAPAASAPASTSMDGHSSERSSSPPPRLPGFAALSPYKQHAVGSSSASSHHLGGGHHHLQGLPPPPISSSHRPHSHQRGDSYGGLPSYATVTSPRLPGQSSMSANSPSLSQASHATPGQAFIHPSLAGLPGAGGGAGSKQQPSFVSKLYSMLEDDTIEDMIAWGSTGMTFSVANPAEFAKVVLPNWFKHSNWQSFVRQLNMYGFHKVNHTYQGTPEEEIQVWEFKHPSFRRGEVHLLSDIKRKSSRHKRQDSLSRSITNAADYDMGMGGTPSPEMGMSRLHGGGMHIPGPPPPPGYGQGAAGQPHGVHHAYSRSIGAGGPVYRDYAQGGLVAVASSQHGHMHVDSSRPSRTQPAGLPHHHVEPAAHEAMIASEGVATRMDDLSDRIDAIIRHASYLEGQLRTVSDQLFQAQQNEASLRTHVHHLESQMRSLSDQLFQQQQVSQHGQQGNTLPPSPSSRMRHMVPASPPSQPGRFQQPAPPSSMQQQSYPARSPVMTAHPSYATRSAPQHSAASGPSGSGRSTPASSADAYTKLGPPPPPSGSGRLKDEPSH